MTFLHETECGCLCNRCGKGECNYLGIACYNGKHWCGCSTPLWHIYILECSDGTLYTGITNDLEARIAKHNSGRGAKYTKTRTPVVLLKSWECQNRSEASKLEYQIKQLSRQEKLAKIANG